MLYFYEIKEIDKENVPEFMPISVPEMENLGVSYPDFVLISGDAYVDHPSFGAAVIGKLLWSAGFSVGIIAMPDIDNPNTFKVFGRPRLGFLVTSGNVDSMVSNYTVAKKRRLGDSYAPGGQAGLRPDRAVTAYTRAIRRVYGDVPVIIGGLEASLRRLAHYDYWSNRVRTSILLESGADLLVYGMGERQTLEIAEALAAGVPISGINYIDGTVYKYKKTGDGAPPPIGGCSILPSYAEVSADAEAYARSFRVQYQNADWHGAKCLAEEYDGHWAVQNPPAVPLTRAELDLVYGLPYARAPHPSYAEGVPSIAEVRFSVTSSRGCFGGCNFCALSFHQGRHVTSRSHESILDEVKLLTELPDFKGYIHDVGGPTANFRSPSCERQLSEGVCPDRKCLAPKPCGSLTVSHEDYLSLLRKMRALPKVKKVFIRSGIRFDYMMLDKDDTFFKDLTEHHISGQLKVAPEHVSDKVLRLMGKPPSQVYDAFTEEYNRMNKELGKKQYLVPYFMSSHPGSGLKEAVELAEYLRDKKITPEQAQDFYPTPGTVSTCMYHTGLNPLTSPMERVHSAQSPHDKALQRALIQYKNPKNKALVVEALKKAKREDLIGYTPKCLVRPDKPQKTIVPNKSPRATNNKP